MRSKEDWQKHFKTPIFELKSFLAPLPRENRKKQYYVIDSPDWVNVVPITKSGKIVLIKQFRHGIGEYSLEVPGGIVDETGDLAPFLSAKRELKEETGYSTTDDKIQLLAKLSGNPAMFTNWAYSYLALDVEPVSSTEFDEGEDIETILSSPGEVKEFLKQGLIHHPHMVSALLLYFLKFDKLDR